MLGKKSNRAAEGTTKLDMQGYGTGLFSMEKRRVESRSLQLPERRLQQGGCWPFLK